MTPRLPGIILPVVFPELTCTVATFQELEGAISEEKSFLSQNEHERAGAYHFEEDRQRFILSRAFLRLFLAQQLNPKATLQSLRKNARELKFTQSLHGKLQLEHQFAEKPLIFSLSRSHNLTAICCGWNIPVGIDVESFTQQRHMSAAFIEDTFSPHEQAQIHASACPSLSALQLWTRKEAIGKADGRNLDIAWPLIETQLEQIEPISLPRALGRVSTWAVQTLIIGDEVISAAYKRC